MIDVSVMLTTYPNAEPTQPERVEVRSGTLSGRVDLVLIPLEGERIRVTLLARELEAAIRACLAREGA